MKKLLFALGMLLSINAHAEIWNLIHSEYHMPKYYCTYQMQNSQIQITLEYVNVVVCPPYIQR